MPFAFPTQRWQCPGNLPLEQQVEDKQIQETEAHAPVAQPLRSLRDVLRRVSSSSVPDLRSTAGEQALLTHRVCFTLRFWNR